MDALRGALATSTGGEHVGRQNANAVLSALSTCGVKTDGVVDARALAKHDGAACAAAWLVTAEAVLLPLAVPRYDG